MTQQYAKDQPEGFKNRVENIAIVGVSDEPRSIFI
jgi:predicted CoA-binding protein